ncbi:MAG: ATP-binding protein [Oscillospiraceae bacterium]|nr:ATP-binding protein [Oscillospiraceae bacterium]
MMNNKKDPINSPNNEITLDCVYDALQDMIFTKDVNGRITSVNHVYAKRTMLSKDEIIGKTAAELGTMSEEAAEGIAQADKQVLEGKTVILTRDWSTYSDGNRTYTETVKTPLIRDGEITGVLVTIRDLTELKLAMEEVDRQNKILETIGQISALMLEPDINALEMSIYQALEIIAHGINADVIDIWRLREDREDAYYSLVYEWKADTPFTSMEDNDGEITFVEHRVIPYMENLLSKGRTINSLVSDLPQNVQEDMKPHGFESVLIVPIILDDEYWGYIGAFDVNHGRHFTENEVLLLRSSRQMIASAMTRMEMTKDIMQKSQLLEYEISSKRDFLARMSHEIRTPMNAIVGMTELALREKMSNIAMEHVMTVKQAGTNLLSIINDILDFSKIESGNMNIVQTSYALSSLMYDIISIIRMRMAYTRIRFIVDIDSKLPCGLIGDEAKIRQILINLLGNAVKYTEKGFVKLRVTGHVRDGDMLSLKMVVSDSGIGIKKEDHESLFRKYIQVDRERNVGIEGVGLGLSITNGLVNAMGGKITVESEYGKGSEFTVVIPQKIDDFDKLAVVIEPETKRTLVYERRSLYVNSLVSTIKNLDIECDIIDNSDDFLAKMASGSYAYAIGSTELMAEVKTEIDAIGGDFQIIGVTEFGEESNDIWRTLSTPVHTISLANVYNGEDSRYVYTNDSDETVKFSAPTAKVLIVDDIVTNLKVAAGLLSPYEVEVDLCISGAESIEAVKENKYDIVFMDHRMPGIDGIEATSIIRAMGEQDEYYKTLPIVALTANAAGNMREVFMGAGFDDFIAKPIDTVVLANVLRVFIPKSKQQRLYALDTNEDTAHETDDGVEISIEGVDVKKGIRTSGNRTDLYLDILATFLDEGSERMTQLHEYRNTGDLRMYTICVHALKGALANIGAAELSEIAATLEAAGDRKNMDYIEAHTDRFLTGIHKLLDSVKSVLKKTARSTNISKPVTQEDTAEFVSLLRELRAALDDMDAGTMNRTLEELLSSALTEQSLSTIRTISKHILMAEFEDAERIVDNLIEILK